MTGTDIDYAGQRDIHNHAIVREVDKLRQRELWRSAAVGVFLVFVLLFSAWQHFELLQLGYRIENLQQEHAGELIINRHLKLEIETLQAPDRVESIATGQLGMVAPGAEEAIVIERVVPPAEADRSLVATR